MIARRLLLCVWVLGASAGLAGADPYRQLRWITDSQDLSADKTLIVLNNCDDSDSDGFVDNKDEYTYGARDLKQLTPLSIRATSPLSGQVKLRISNATDDTVEPTEQIRIFRAREVNSLDPQKSPRFVSIVGGRWGTECLLDAGDLAQFPKNDVKLYIEGLSFGTFARLELLKDGVKQDELIVQVAPFLLVPHTQLPLESMVVQIKDRLQDGRSVDDPTSSSYVQQFARACQNARSTLSGPAGQFHSHVVINDDDVWIEDELQWGYTETPRVQMPVALHMHRERDLQPQVRALLAPELGYFEACDYRRVNEMEGAEPDWAGDSIHYGGNLEIAPPTKEFPYGRVYYGGTMSKNPDDADRPRQMAPLIQAFFKRQKARASDKTAIQEPIPLHTDWLAVGHVDEIVSFVPANNARGYVLLWASPGRALELLDSLPPQSRNQLAGLNTQRYAHYDQDLQTVDDLLDLDWKTLNSGVASFLGQQSMRDYNRKLEPKIMENVQTFKRELGLSDADIKAVPVLFCNELTVERDPKTGKKYRVPAAGWSAVALTPGMVNLSAWGGVNLMANPFIEVFRERVKAMLGEIGQTAEFIDDWQLYHICAGEVHCGSNTRREPFAAKWWARN